MGPHLADLLARNGGRYVKIEWVNCHEHALVNTFGGMSKAGMSKVAEKMGAELLNELSAIQSGKSYDKSKNKFHTGDHQRSKPRHGCCLPRT